MLPQEQRNTIFAIGISKSNNSNVKSDLEIYNDFDSELRDMTESCLGTSCETFNNWDLDGPFGTIANVWGSIYAATNPSK